MAAARSTRMGPAGAGGFVDRRGRGCVGGAGDMERMVVCRAGTCPVWHCYDV